MKSQALAFMAESPLLMLPLAALFLFLLVFASVVVRVLWRGGRAYQDVAALPLEEAPLVAEFANPGASHE